MGGGGGGDQGLEAALSMVFSGNEEKRRSHSASWWRMRTLRQCRLGPVTQDLGGGGVGGGARGVAAVRSSAGDSDTHARRAGDTGLCSSH